MSVDEQKVIQRKRKRRKRLTLADWRELVVEAGVEAGAAGRPDEEAAGVAAVLDARADLVLPGRVLGPGRLRHRHRRVRWLLGSAAGSRFWERVKFALEKISMSIGRSVGRSVSSPSSSRPAVSWFITRKSHHHEHSIGKGENEPFYISRLVSSNARACYVNER